MTIECPLCREIHIAFLRIAGVSIAVCPELPPGGALYAAPEWKGVLLCGPMAEEPERRKKGRASS